MDNPTTSCDECGGGGAYNRTPCDPRALCDRCHDAERLREWLEILWQMNHENPATDV